MKVEYVIKNDSHQDGTFYADGQWVTLIPGSMTTVGSRPADMSINLTIVKKLVNDSPVIMNEPHKPTIVTKPSKPLNEKDSGHSDSEPEVIPASDDKDNKEESK